MPQPTTARRPITELDAPYSSPGAVAVPWPAAVMELDRAGVYWLTTVRPEGRPHVTAIAGVWMDDAVCFATGPQERKSKNLAENPHVVVTTGCNEFRSGLDVVIEGTAVAVRADSKLERLAETFEAKYEGQFGFRVGTVGSSTVTAVPPTSTRSRR